MDATSVDDDRRYLWDGDRIVTRFAGIGGSAIAERYVFTPGSLGAPVTVYAGGGTATADRRYALTDERGSVIALTDGGTGAQLAANSYGPFGQPGTGNAGAFQYAGQLWLPEAGLTYMRNRVYSAELGRFLQTDPIGYQGGMNLYAYVLNDPVNATDPWGLEIVVTGQPRGIELSQPSLAVLFGIEDLNRIFQEAIEQIPELNVIVVTGCTSGSTAEQEEACIERRQDQCETGPRINLGFGVSATLFGLIAGASGAGSVNASIPIEAFSTGDFRGTQFGLTGSGTILGGIGAFAGAGNNFTLGFSDGPQENGWDSVGVIQGGAGYGGGVEVSGDLSEDNNFSVSGGGRLAIGAYGGFGRKFILSGWTRPIGC